MVVGTAVTQFGMGGAYPPPHQSPPQPSSSSVAATGEKQQQLHAFWAEQYGGENKLMKSVVGGIWNGRLKLFESRRRRQFQGFR
ncbi:hypothetical protein QJS10_CPA06g00870 [Acorus calamus]|uniref:Uncharacterized protein n=1 Tax=Acorus calamus TaxID=4465 RepID=A0AAV9EKX3_ACOCL|nr:hypothetical protein QJS10_CPA06g00870 [Acorus calamus]